MKRICDANEVNIYRLPVLSGADLGGASARRWTANTLRSVAGGRLQQQDDTSPLTGDFLISVTLSHSLPKITVRNPHVLSYSILIALNFALSSNS